MFVRQPMAIQTFDFASSLWMEESGIWPDFFLNIKKMCCWESLVLIVSMILN